MPLYNSNVATATPMTAIYPGDSFLLHNAETIIAGNSSIAIAIPTKDGSNPQSLSVELIFSGAPGAFECDVQDADTDTPSAYLTIPNVGQMTVAQTGTDSKAVARIELAPFKGKFFRLNWPIAPANAVTVIAKVTS